MRDRKSQSACSLDSARDRDCHGGVRSSPPRRVSNEGSEGTGDDHGADGAIPGRDGVHSSRSSSTAPIAAGSSTISSSTSYAARCRASPCRGPDSQRRQRHRQKRRKATAPSPAITPTKAGLPPGEEDASPSRSLCRSRRRRRASSWKSSRSACGRTPRSGSSGGLRSPVALIPDKPLSSSRSGTSPRQAHRGFARSRQQRPRTNEEGSLRRSAANAAKNPLHNSESRIIPSRIVVSDKIQGIPAGSLA